MLAKPSAYKNILLTFSGIFLIQLSIAQTNVWDGSASNLWNNPANWSLNVTPKVGHDVVIPISANISLNSTPQTLKSLTVSGGATVSLTATGGTRTLTLSNPGAAGLDVQVGSTLTIQGTGTTAIRIQFSGAGTLGNIAGTLNLEAGGAGGFYSATNSITTVTGTLKRVKGTIVSNDINLTIADGGTYQHALNGGAIPVASWGFGSFLNLTGLTTTYPTGMGQIFGSVIFSSTLTSNVFMNSDLFASADLTLSNTGAGSMILNNRTVFLSITVGGTFTQNSGTFILVNSTGESTLDIGGNFTLNGGSFIEKNAAGNATLNIAGTMTIAGGLFDQRAASNVANSSVNVFGNFVLTGGVYDMNGVNNTPGYLTVFGDFSYTGGSLTETAAGTSNGQVIFGGFIQTFTSGGAVNPTSIIHYTINPGVVLQFADPSTIITGAGSFSTSAGSTLGITSAQGIAVTGATGNVQVTGTRTYATGTSYIYNGTTDQVAGTGLSQHPAEFITIENAGNTVTLSGNVVATADLVISNGTLSASSFNLTIGGEWVNLGDFIPGTGKVTLNGAGVQNISGATTTTFNTLELAKTTGTVLLNQDILINSALNLDVVLDIGNFNLTMGNTAQNIGTVTGTFGPTKMIVASGSGEVRKNATSAAQATYAFPIGDNSGTEEFSPVGILFSGGTYNGYVAVKVVDDKHPNNLNITDYLTRYWIITQTGFSGFTAQAGFNYVDDDIVGTETEIRLGEWTGAEPWLRFDPSIDPSLNALGATLTVFGEMSGLSVSEALPIHFGSIRGWAPNSSSINVEWKILGETGTSHYEIEKLQSANNFVKIGTQEAGNSGLDVTYSFTDLSPLTGDNFYRIKGIELTGEITYSPVVRVKINGSGAREMKIYPNPVKGNSLAISLQNFKAGKYEMTITNNLGQVIYSRGIDQPAGTTTITVPLNNALARGMYRLRLTNGEDTYISSFIKE